ncbi:hypothetical protein R80B4_02830 [Fibrobacteres bacterium R8-0-B4]
MITSMPTITTARKRRTHWTAAVTAFAAGALWGCGWGEEYESVTIGGKTWMKENLNIATLDSWCHGEGGAVYDYDNGGWMTSLQSWEIQANCKKYGRLYTWDAARTACPSGWRLPSRDDWDQLAEYVGGTKASNYGTRHDWLGAGMKLKSRRGWGGDQVRRGGGTDDYWFPATLRWLGVGKKLNSKSARNGGKGQGGNGTDDFGFSALPGGRRYRSDGSFHDAGGEGCWWTATEHDDRAAYYRGMDRKDDNLSEDYNYKNYGYSVRCIAE